MRQRYSKIYVYVIMITAVALSLGYAFFKTGTF